MSGHSRWSQVKHKKALSDAKRGRLFSKMGRLIGVAAKEKGGDPAANPKLRFAIEKARSIGMPKENIERAVKRGASSGDAKALAEVFYEAYGPGGAALLILGVTDNKNRTTNEIKHILSEYGGKFGQAGSVEWLFEKVGTVNISKESEKKNGEDATLKLIDAGARDIKEYPDGISAYVLPDDIESFKKELTKRGVAFSDSSIDYRPKTPLLLNKEDADKLERLLAALDEHDDVQEIFTNANF